MEKRRVVITGLGTVNPLGNTAADSWAAAKAGRCGIGPITQFDTTDFKCKLAEEFGEERLQIRTVPFGFAWERLRDLQRLWFSYQPG